MDVEKLISEVFIRTALWDQTHKNHHNRYVLDKLWNEVASTMNTTRVSVRAKWKSLRDKFRTTLASIPKAKSGDAAAAPQYEGQWQYFHSLLFLRDQFTPREHGGNFILHSPEGGNPDEEPSMRGSFEDEVHEEEPPSASTPSSSQKRKRGEVGYKLLEIENKKLQYLEEKKRNVPEEDEDLAFFKSIVPHIRDLSGFDKISFRMGVLKLAQQFMKKKIGKNWIGTRKAPEFLVTPVAPTRTLPYKLLKLLLAL